MGNPNTPAPLREELKNQLLDSSKNQTDVILALAYNLCSRVWQSGTIRSSL
ncbi:MAG: hypothetical protein F6K54_30070 [Okeania sp. SIO3B5]|uniref:hypothetical protein n=1 Tax=Okeania sp. SIO3B5 TaxID=2607811 RepID=UPI0013FF6B20|nr:hypothetical protein [Okeania sp. SIO3B5]NEO56948.1 hypothetical protein [Okeania sp. SIO3B5]